MKCSRFPEKCFCQKMQVSFPKGDSPQKCENILLEKMILSSVQGFSKVCFKLDKGCCSCDSKHMGIKEIGVTNEKIWENCQKIYANCQK